jgi:hypothetical protein
MKKEAAEFLASNSRSMTTVQLQDQIQERQEPSNSHNELEISDRIDA